MEKLDLTKLLKDCPKGTKLYSPALGEVTLAEVIENSNYPIKVEFKVTNDKDTRIDYFTKNGYVLPNKPDAECMLFPSKYQKDWSEWHRPFRDGDIVTCDDQIAIFKEYIDEDNGLALCHVFMSSDLEIDIDSDYYVRDFASQIEKDKLFWVLHDKGYKWNPKTKTLEKLIEPKFNVGDKIKHEDTILTIIAVQTNRYIIEDEPNNFGILMFSQQDEWESVPDKIEPKFKVGDKIFNVFRKCMGSSSIQGVISEIKDDKYIFTDGSYIETSNQDSWELVSNMIKPKFKVGDKVKHNGDDTVITVIGVKDYYYLMQFYNKRTNLYQNESVSFEDQDQYELDSDQSKLDPNKFNSKLEVITNVLDRSFEKHHVKFETMTTVYGFLMFWSEVKREGEVMVITFDNFETYLNEMFNQTIEDFGFDLENLKVGESYKSKDDIYYMRIW